MSGRKCPTPTKHRHADKAAALLQLRDLRRKGQLGPDWNVYLCRCGVWHAGHKPGALAFRIRRALRRRRS